MIGVIILICKYCGNKIDSNSTICFNCGMINDKYMNISFGSKFISCILPFVGIFMFLILKFNKNRNANDILVWTIGGIFLWILLYIFAFFMGIILTFQI